MNPKQITRLLIFIVVLIIATIGFYYLGVLSNTYIWKEKDEGWPKFWAMGLTSTIGIIGLSFLLWGSFILIFNWIKNG